MSKLRLVWSDEFTGPAGTPPDAAKWNFDLGGWGDSNGELENYVESAALDGKGHLAITARKEASGGKSYTSGRIETFKKYEFTYGLLEARIKVPSGAGLWPAFWTLGREAYVDDAAWPGCGEVDVMEILGQEPNVLYGTVHVEWEDQGIVHSPTPLSDAFHVYAMEWTADKIALQVDGKTYKTVKRTASRPWPFDRPNFILLNLAVGGNWPGPPDASTRFPAQMLVDYVRVYQ